MSILQKITKQIYPYMNEQGYTLSKKCFYKIHNDIAYCLEFEMPSGLVYVTFFVMPLYITAQHHYYTYGNRVGSLRHSKLLPLSKNASEDELNAWCKILLDSLDKVILPFFQKIDSPVELLKIIEKRKHSIKNYFFCPPVQIFRLQLFSYLYTEEFGKLRVLTKKYPRIIQESTYFTKDVRNSYLEENDFIMKLVQDDGQTASAFCAKTIQDTIRNCFR